MASPLAWHPSPAPPLGQLQAFALLILYCLLYVLPLHSLAATRAAPGKSRDAPDSIRARIRVVSLATLVCCLSTLLIIGRSSSIADSLHYMGFWPLGWAEAASCLLLTAILFAGPLFEFLLIDGLWRQWTSLGPLAHLWGHWPSWRNVVAGPFTEECLFRSASVPLLLLSGSALKRIVFLSPLVFGLAHLHHFHEFRTTYPEAPLAAAVARSVFQFGYTFIFGAYQTFLFLRTGSLLAVFLVHAFCNCMGLPRVWGSVEPYWLLSGRGGPAASRMFWTSIYYVLLVSGALLWRSNLYFLTQSSMALAST